MLGVTFPCQIFEWLDYYMYQFDYEYLIQAEN